MIDTFLENTCTISNLTSTMSWWEAVYTEVVVYTAIPCKYFLKWSSSGYDSTKSAVNTSISDINCIIQPDKISVRKGMKIVVYEDEEDYNLWIAIWSYTIESKRKLKKHNGDIDHIALILKEVWY